MTTLEMLEEMGTTKNPWNLFEPHLRKDKLNDCLWHCDLRATNGIIVSSSFAPNPEEAISQCYVRHKKRWEPMNDYESDTLNT